MSGLMGTVAQGMAFGTGSAIAHRAVGAIADSFGGDDKAAPQQEFQQQAPPAKFAEQSKVYILSTSLTRYLIENNFLVPPHSL